MCSVLTHELVSPNLTGPRSCPIEPYLMVEIKVLLSVMFSMVTMQLVVNKKLNYLISIHLSSHTWLEATLTVQLWVNWLHAFSLPAVVRTGYRA